MDTALRPSECDNCDETLAADEPSYYLQNLPLNPITICRRCYQTTTWDQWEVSRLDPTHEIDIRENLKVAYEKVFTGGYKNESTLRRFYYREVPKLSLEATAHLRELTKDLFVSIRPLDQFQRRGFQNGIYRRLRILGLSDVALWSPSADDDEGLLNIDWALLKTPMDCLVLYVILEDVHTDTIGPIDNRRLLLSTVLRQPTAEETAALAAEYQRLVESKQAETMRLEAEKYAVGHDVATFNHLFVENLVKNPQNLHRLLKIAYFQGNMHRCKECICPGGECSDCYSRDTEFDMTHDDTLGTVWQQTVASLGGKKIVPVKDDSDGEEDDE
jgi:hypothetical protein